MRQSTLAGLLVGLVLAGPLQAASSVRSYQEARAVLDAGIKAAGGQDALREIKDLSREATGTAYAQGQSLLPDAPLLARAIEVKTFQDFAGGRSATLFTQTGSGVLPTKTRTVAIENGFTYNLMSKTQTPMTPTALTASRSTLRRDPAVLLLTALDRAETLRSLGDETVDGKRLQRITFSTADGAQIALAFDVATGLLSRVETLADNAVLGDALTETVLLEYQEVAVGARRVKLPGRVVTRVAGETTQDLKYGKVVVNGGPASGLLDPPTDAETVPAAPPGGPVAITKLADDVYFAGGGSHHSLFVVFADYVVVLEAPLNEERSLAVLAKIAETAPGKPVRYVVPTHYHFDHSGGLRTYMAKGITIVTTPGNKAMIERLAKAPHTIRPDSLSRAPKAPVIETFTGKRVFDDGLHTLELRDIGPTPHVTEAVIGYLPKQKTVFVADLFTIPVQGPFPPASPALVDFADKLHKHGLVVEAIAPGHGRLGTLGDLAAALSVKPPAN